jgi:glyceraldehyde-3-phosphate dehydrogenase (NADP+)
MTDRPLAHAFPTSMADVPERFRPVADETGLTLLVNGHVIHWEGAREQLLSPVCTREGDTLARVPLGPAAQASAEMAMEALRAAEAAWAGGRGDWPRATAAERIAAVRAFVGRALPLRETVARTLMWEVGKPWADCLVEFDRTFKYIEDTIETVERMEREAWTPQEAEGFAARIRRTPLGVALCMGPYNYAVNEVFTTVIPALIMGNPVVMKTPRFGVQANALFAPAMAASFPPGVVNLVTGSGSELIGPMMKTGEVDVLAFIGSARTAGLILGQHPRPYRLRTVLGLGAKNPAIVLRDADLDATSAEIVSGALTFGGQRCTAIKHVLVARAVAEPLLERLAARVSALRLGMPWEEGVVVTPLPDPGHPDFLAGLIDDAVQRGARVLNPGGGERAATLFRPALVSPVDAGARLFHEEQFGPILPVTPFDHVKEALDAVDRSEVGQQASVFGQDLEVMGHLVDHLANMVCRVNVNTQCRRGPDVFPFGGRKDSAVGTLSVYDALRSFSIRSLVAVKTRDRDLLDRLPASSRFLAAPPAE